MNLNEFCAMALSDSVNAGPEPTAPECETCSGSGEIEEACGRDEFGVYETDTWPCPDCDGTGGA
jgi:DnaJ-class molecular chaperone